MRGWPTVVTTPWFEEADNCHGADPSLEFIGWRALQPNTFHFIVVILLLSGEMLIYVVHFIPFLPTCSYT